MLHRALIFLTVTASALLGFHSLAVSEWATVCTYDGTTTYQISASVVVRSGPSERRTWVYELPADADAIRCVGPCRNGWCRIRWHGVVGWIPRSRLKVSRGAE